MNRFKDGDLDGARQGFAEFLVQHPHSDLAPNARFWLGESFYGKKDYPRAIWGRVFTVMGGFMMGAGALTILVGIDLARLSRGLALTVVAASGWAGPTPGEAPGARRSSHLSDPDGTMRPWQS